MFAALCFPAAAGATVTIGSNLARTPEGPMSSFGCSPPCTFSQATLAVDRQAPGGLLAPVNGTVTLWRIGAAGASTPTALRIIKPLSGGLFTAAGTSATVTPALHTVSSFPTNLPIAIGDAIGINCCQPVAEYFLLSGGTMNQWHPVLADGGAGRTSGGAGDPHEIVLNADIEPTSTFTAAVTARNGGRVRIAADLPNPGTIVAGDKRDAKLASAAGGKAKLLKRSSTDAISPGPVGLVVTTTKAGRAALARNGKLKVKVKIVYTPTGGSASTQTFRVKLKAKA